MAPPSPGPFPPADFASRELPIEEIPSGARLIRIHRSDRGPLFFGSTGGNRFDDPAKIYGVCYLATTLEGAFAETCLRSVGARFVALTFLEARSFSEIEVSAPLRLVSLHGPGLAQIGATGAVTSGPHAVAQQWSQAIHDHPTVPDGIAYRSNHDNGEICVALFEHVGDHLAPSDPQPMTTNRTRLAKLLARYKVGLG
ncbi:MAG: hypothetical protein CTY25_07745 [Methylobacterium sp.]|jgi:hypothetical protein|nr:MAG: hypothetical protein CTY25_07745 [Methylobacterium sp.]